MMRVFISSVEAGSEQFRDAAAEAVEMLGHQVIRAEAFPASPRTPQQACLAAVREADLVVLLIGARYGELQTSGRSATHEEYLEARERKPMLLFVQDEITPERVQQSFLQEIEEWATGHNRSRFVTPKDLNAAVVRALHNHELANSTGPVDESEIHARAKALLPDTRVGSSSPLLLLGVAAGPRQQVLRPTELEDDRLHQDLQQEAMFGPYAVFDRGAATRTKLVGGELILEQPSGSVAVDELGTIRVVQPAQQQDSADWIRHIPALIEEDLTDALARAIQFSASILTRIDPLGRLTDVVPIVAITKAGYQPWRTRAEQIASPNSATMGSGKDLITATLTPLRRHRQALTHDTIRLTEDLITLLRRDRQVR